MKNSIIYPDPYPKETVEEIIEKCRQAYFKNCCDKFNDFKEGHESNRPIHGS